MHANPQYALCRTFGHDWDILEAADIEDSMLSIWHAVFVLRCVRCTMRRVDGINAFGEVAQRSYSQPEGYKYTEQDTPTRAEFRLYVAAEVLKQRKGR